MKARVKATGVIVNVTHSHNLTSGGVVMKKIYKDQLGSEYFDSELEFLQEGEYTPDYWEKLLHQYAGMAMQGMLSNPDLLEVVTEKKGLTKKEYADKIACVADIYATALVEKLKES